MHDNSANSQAAIFRHSQIDHERSLWAQVYMSAYERGKSPADAKSDADQFLSAYREVKEG